MLEDLEVFGGISARARQQNVISPWMTAHQGFQIVDFVVDDHVPEAQILVDLTAAGLLDVCSRCLLKMLWHLCCPEALCHSKDKSSQVGLLEMLYLLDLKVWLQHVC